MADSEQQAPLLELQNLSISLRAEQKQLVSNVNLQVLPGETLALVGDSGAGKSITAHAIPGLLPQSMQVNGHIRFHGQELNLQNTKALRAIRGNKIGMVFQEPMSSLNPLHKVGRQVSETLIQHQGLSKAEAQQQVLKLFADVELPTPNELYQRLPHQLSGGQRQRVMIAMAIANKPSLLIADEPTTALDVSVQKQILELIKRLQCKYQMAVLFITHDLCIVRRYADRICVMSDGAIIEQGSNHDIFKHPKHPITQTLTNSTPQGKPFPVPVSPDHQLTFRTFGLSAWYRKQTSWFFRLKGKQSPVIDNITLSLKPGETLGLVGESGSGKTSLGLAVLRMLNSEGEQYLQNQPVHTLTEQQFRPLRKNIQLVFQDPYGSLNPRMTIREILEEGLNLHFSLSPSTRLEKMQETLTEVGLSEDTLLRYPHEFSGGQRQRIALARAIILKPALLILDEPTSSLDRRLQRQLIALLRELQRKHQMSYLFISHDLSVIRAMSHRIAVIRQGRIIESGPTELLLKQPKDPYTRTLMNAAFDISTP